MGRPKAVAERAVGRHASKQTTTQASCLWLHEGRQDSCTLQYIKQKCATVSSQKTGSPLRQVVIIRHPVLQPGIPRAFDSPRTAFFGGMDIRVIGMHKANTTFKLQ